jgi:hypothetical protein
MSEARVWTIEEFVEGARPPSDDDVPMTLDWTPLDTRARLAAHLEEINRRRAPTMPADPGAFEVERILATLDRHGVEYILVGGLGARAHGATTPTRLELYADLHA